MTERVSIEPPNRAVAASVDSMREGCVGDGTTALRNVRMPFIRWSPALGFRHLLSIAVDSYSFPAEAQQALSLVADGILPIAAGCGCLVADRDRRDAHAMLKHLLDAHKRSFDQPLTFRFDPATKPLAHEVRLLRNDLSHGGAFDSEKEFRLLSSCWRLLSALAAPEAGTARSLVDRWLQALPVGRDVTEHEVVVNAPPHAAVDPDGRDGAPIAEVEPTVGPSSRAAAAAAGLRSVDAIISTIYGRSVRTYGKMHDAGWVYQGESTVECPQCATLLDVCRLGYYPGPPDHRSWAVVCVPCGTARRKQEYPPHIRSALWRWGLQYPIWHAPIAEPPDDSTPEQVDDRPTVDCPACGQAHWSEPGVEWLCAVCDTPLPFQN